MIGRGRKRRGYIRSIKGKTVQKFFPWKDRELKRISLSLSLIDQTERNRFDVCDNLTTWRYLDRRQFLIVLSRIYQRNFTDSLLSRSGFNICRISVESPERLNFILRLIYIYTHPPPAPIRPSVRNRAGNWPGFSRRSPLGDGPHYTCNRDTGRRPLGFAVSLCVSRCVKVC